MLVELTDSVDLEKEVLSTNKLVVIDFWAEWCGPCKRIAPDYEKLPEQFTNVNFYKVNVDDCPELTAKFKIEKMPTFLFYRQKELGRIEGANLANLVKAIEELS